MPWPGRGGRAQPGLRRCCSSGLNGRAFEGHASVASELSKPSAYPKPTALLCSHDLLGPQPGPWAGGRGPQWPHHSRTAASSPLRVVSWRGQWPGLAQGCVHSVGGTKPGGRGDMDWASLALRHRGIGGPRSTTYTRKYCFLPNQRHRLWFWLPLISMGPR